MKRSPLKLFLTYLAIWLVLAGIIGFFTWFIASQFLTHDCMYSDVYLQGCYGNPYGRGGDWNAVWLWTIGVGLAGPSLIIAWILDNS